MLQVPLRIQRKRTKGWRMPPNTVCVTRPGFWGNPFKGRNQMGAALMYELALTRPANIPYPNKRIEKIISKQRERLNELRGKNLACFCSLEVECHADVLLREANRT